MSNTPAQLLNSILQEREYTGFPDIIPVNPPITSIMEKSGVYWPDAHRDAVLMADLAASCQEMLKFNAVNVPFDMTVEAEALGCEIVWKEGISVTPQVKEHERDEKEVLSFGDDVFSRGRFPVVLKALSRLHDRYKGAVPLISFMEGPFTVAGLVFGVNRVYKNLIKDPDHAKHLLNRLCELAKAYARLQLDAGADTIIMLDPNVMGLTVVQFNEFVLPLYLDITSRIDTPLILHICGNINPLLPSIAGSRFAALSFDYPAVQVASVKSALGDRMKIVGSVPTITHLLHGTRDEVFSLSLEMIESGVHLLAPSCFTPPGAPFENVKAMMDAIHHWNQQHA
jgi:MtaA/CmuA family methyltransferase